MIPFKTDPHAVPLPWRIGRTLLFAAAVYTLFWGLGAATSGSASGDIGDRRAREARRFAAELEAFNARLHNPTALRALPRTSTAAPDREEHLLGQEADRLGNAMVEHFTSAGASVAEAERRDLRGLARFIVYSVDRRAREHQWVPLGRTKAPSMLAAIAFHESSWRWRSSQLRGGAGERGAWQVHPTTSRHFGFNPRDVAASPEVAFAVALRVMNFCAEQCGQDPERWLACYAQKGQCSGAEEVVESRLATTRELLRLAVR